ncbi:MAG: chemotaxis protein CheB, partial [Alphaproteobacteria bacterium]|nr:chemotaxis protein CheB [Alphaproteobacteria bacterium]
LSGFATPPAKPLGAPGTPPSVVVIGVSTGGPGTLEEILTLLPADFPWAILIAQHMPAGFTGLFSRRLDESCAITVREVTQPMPIEPGTVYIGRGDADFVMTRRGRQLMATAVPASAEWFWHPSVDHLVYSAMKYLPPTQLIGVLLTGMGSDGANAMTALHEAGSLTIAESEESAVVFGMPQELIKLGGADVVLPAGQVAGKLMEWVSRASRRQRLG